MYDPGAALATASFPPSRTETVVGRRPAPISQPLKGRTAALGGGG